MRDRYASARSKSDSPLSASAKSRECFSSSYAREASRQSVRLNFRVAVIRCLWPGSGHRWVPNFELEHLVDWERKSREGFFSFARYCRTSLGLKIQFDAVRDSIAWPFSRAFSLLTMLLHVKLAANRCTCDFRRKWKAWKTVDINSTTRTRRIVIFSAATNTRSVVVDVLCHNKNRNRFPTY